MEAVALRAAKPLSWLTAGPLCLAVLAALPFLFWQTSVALYGAWNGTTAFNYCFLVLPVCALLAWERREKLLAADPAPSLAGFAILLAAGAAWLLGELTGSVVVSEFALVIMAQGTVVAILGLAAARTLLFPLGYMLFLVPVGESFIPFLQSVTAGFAVILLKLSGLPIHSDGLVIVLPPRTWLVADACAGLKFLVASLALGVLLCEMFLASWRRRALFLALSVIIPIAANGLRVYLIIVIAWLSNGRYAVGMDHILYGWLLFALVLGGMIGIAIAMREPVAEDGLRLAPKTGAASPAPVTLLAAGFAALLMLISVKAAAMSLESRPLAAPVPARMPLAVTEHWRAVAAEDPYPPLFPGTDRIWRQAYSDGAATVYLTVGYFAYERSGAEAASSRQAFGGANPKSLTGTASRQIEADSQIINAATLSFGARYPKRFVWHWLWIDGRYTGNPYLAKLLQLKIKLLRDPPAAAVVSVATDYGAGGETKAENALARFAADMRKTGAARGANP